MENYDKRTWISKEIIAATKLNNIENGIDAAFAKITDVEGKLSASDVEVIALFDNLLVEYTYAAESPVIVCDTANIATVIVSNAGPGNATVEIFTNYTDGGNFASTAKETFTVAAGRSEAASMVVDFYSMKVVVTGDADITISATSRVVFNKFDDNGINVYNSERLGGETLVEVTDRIDSRVQEHADATSAHGVFGYILGSEDFGQPGGVAQLDAGSKLAASQVPDSVVQDAEFSSHSGDPSAHHSNLNDPTTTEKAALAGTSGSPSSDNKYVTSTDGRLSDARTPLSHGNDKHSTAYAAESALTGHTTDTLNPHDVTAVQVGAVPATEKGTANGVATLDSNGKVPVTQISDSVLGQVEYKGLWNAATNTPTLPLNPVNNGDYYVVSDAGTFAGLTFEVGDWIISNGSTWDKVDNTDAVSSVFGRTGNVTAQSGDYTAEQVGAIPATEKGVASGVATLDATGKVPVEQIGDISGGMEIHGDEYHSVDYLPTSGGTATDLTITNDAFIKILYPSGGGVNNKIWSPGSNALYIGSGGEIGFRIGTIGYKLNLTSSVLESLVNIDFKNVYKAINMSDPTAAQDAATKNYVDTQISGIDAMSIHGNEYHSVAYIPYDDVGISGGIASLDFNGYLDPAQLTVPSGTSLNAPTRVGQLYYHTENRELFIGAYNGSTYYWVRLPYARPIPFDTFTASDDLAFYVVTGGYCAFADATSGLVALQLPDAAGHSGYTLTVKKIDSSSNNVNITVAVGDDIDGQSSLQLTEQYDAYTVVSDGTNWKVISTTVSSGGSSGSIGIIPKTVRFDGVLSAGNAQQFSTLEVNATLTTVRVVLRGSLPVGQSIKVQVTKNGASPTDSVLTADAPIELLTTAVAETNGLYVVEGSLDSGMTECSALDWFQATITQVGSDYAGNDLDIQLVFE